MPAGEACAAMTTDRSPPYDLTQRSSWTMVVCAPHTQVSNTSYGSGAERYVTSVTEKEGSG